MIRQLFDPANAITAAGLVLSALAIQFAISGRPQIGVAIVLWALLADHLDGVVAQRTRRRRPETGQIGKNLDSLADLVSAGIFPCVALAVVGHGSAVSVAVGAALVVASALRLSYFNVFGLSRGCFIGVPTTYAVPATTLLFLVRPFVSENLFPTIFAIVLLIIAVLHVTPIKVPRTSGRMYWVVTAFCIAASGFLGTTNLNV